MEVKIFQVVRPDLATRNGCDKLFELLEQTPEKKITLDFSNVSSISRSFAHQYLRKKNLSKKVISEVHVPILVQRMLDFVKNQTEKKPIADNNLRSELISTF
jgi:Ethanolamine utilization protein EutJ (predicted chaperonin)